MQIFGRRPRQKRGSRCFVLLLPLLLIFAVFLILTIVQFPGLDTKGKITDLCLTGFFGLVYILAAMWLYRRTRRFYSLGKAENYPCAAIRAKFSRDGRSIEIEFFADDADAVRPFVIADDFGGSVFKRTSADRRTEGDDCRYLFQFTGKLRQNVFLPRIYPLRSEFSAKQKDIVRKEVVCAHLRRHGKRHPSHERQRVLPVRFGNRVAGAQTKMAEQRYGKGAVI